MVTLNKKEQRRRNWIAKNMREHPSLREKTVSPKNKYQRKKLRARDYHEDTYDQTEQD